MATVPAVSLFYFSSDADGTAPGKYDLLIKSATLADQLGLRGVWVPERHFLRFGGLYGTPSVTAAALAVLTKRLRICAGSVVLPLQDPLRVTEEWAMIDNLSGGRVDLAIASGWHPNDFVLNPAAYARRNEEVAERIAIVQRLWRGETIERPNGIGDPVPIRVRPQPLQAELPVWLTAHSDAGFEHASQHGYNVLTANFRQDHDRQGLAARIAGYRERMRARHGRPGHVTLMSHTYIGTRRQIDEMAVPTMLKYITSMRQMQTAIPSNTREERRLVLDAELGANRILKSDLSLILPPEAARQRLSELAALGVDEVACLIDFGPPLDETLASVERLGALVAAG